MRRPPAAGEDQFARIAPYYDELMANVPYDMWAGYVCQLAALADRPLEPGSKLLDLATGTGSVALEFAARGCDVTGVDLSAPMIQQAKRNASARRLKARFLRCNLEALELEGEFDHAVCLYDSLNYLLDLTALEHAFAHVRGALKPDGAFVFDVNTVRALEGELFTQRSRPGSAVQYDWTSHYNPETRISTIVMDFRIPAKRHSFTVVQRQRAYTDAELRSALTRAGFGEISAYEAYQVSPPGPQSDRVFYVARPAR